MTENMQMQKLIEECGSSQMDTILINYLYKVETKTREMAAARNRSYRSFSSAARNGIGRKHLARIHKSAREEAIYATLGSETANTFKEKSFNNALRSYQSTEF